jgi:hypothetical protein
LLAAARTHSLRLATRHGLTALARQIEPILNRIRDRLK